MKRLALGPLVLLAIVTPLSARQSSPAASSPSAGQAVFRSTTSLVALNVTVTDGKRFVGGLRLEDFTVLEDNIPQQVQFFETTDVPLDLILLLDTSASMSDKIDVVHEAALGFLRTLRPTDRGAVVAFSDGVDVLQSLTSDKPPLESAVKRTEAHGGTALNNAIYVALKQFGRPSHQSGTVRRQAIAVLTDGADTSSVIGFDDVLELARKSDVNIYTIGLQARSVDAVHAGDGARRFQSPSDYSMKTLAQETGAQAFFPEFVQDLKAIYAAIAEELSNQYSLGYTSSDTRSDGRFRRVVVRVANRPELRLRSRTGYMAVPGRTAALVNPAR